MTLENFQAEGKVQKLSEKLEEIEMIEKITS